MRGSLHGRISRRARRLRRRSVPGALEKFGIRIPRARRAGFKIFCVGFNKTGTSSLHALFQQAGFRSHHSPVWRDMNDQLLSRYECFCDGRPDDFVELTRRYPRGRFILNVRDLDAWLASRLDHVRRDNAASERKRERIYWDDTDRALRSWVDLRNRYHCLVLDHCRNSPLKLLVVNLPRDPRAVEKIYSFLGLAAAPAKSPHKNANRYGDSLTRNRDRVRRLLEQLDIPSAEHGNDILCPSLLPTDQPGIYPPDTSRLASCVWPIQAAIDEPGIC